MKDLVILIDMSNLAFRILHTIGHLSNSIIWGTLQEILKLEKIHQTTRIGFCFDLGNYKRKEIYPPYKLRKEKTSEELESISELYDQLQTIRTEILPELGYKNIFATTGFEADDLMASVVNTHKHIFDFVLSSTDKDLYQLLGKGITVWNHHKNGKLTTWESFKETYGIAPSYWPDVKAIAGCTSDNIKGIKGVGEKTAIKYLLGTLAHSTKKWKDIVRNKKAIEDNWKLVKLPYPGTPEFVLQKDRVSREAWNKIVHKYEMKTLIDNFPMASRF